MQSEGLTFFDFFLNCLSIDFKMRSKRGRGACPVIARVGMLQRYWWISDEMSTCAPRNDFLNNKDQTIKHLEFKFDPIPTKSAALCLFQERCIRNILHGKFGKLLLKYGLVYYQNGLVQIDI